MSNRAIDKVPVWLDCDPGHDDAFAILLAAWHPGIELLGISTVYGNTSVENTTINAASLLTAMGKHNTVPVYAGAAHGIARPQMHPPTAIHGETGIDGTDLLPQPLQAPNTIDDAIEAMATALFAQPKGSAFLVATGTLTNIALLVERYPQVVSRLKGLSIMGGVFGGGFTDIILGRVDDKERIGNFTPWAEFNIIADPEAAAAIFGNKGLAAKTTLVPLDLSHQVLATTEVCDLLSYGVGGSSSGNPKTALRQMLVELLLYFARTYADMYGITAGPPLHDPIAVAAVLRGTVYEIPFYDEAPNEKGDRRHKERFSVSVVTEGSYKEAAEGKTQTGRTLLTKLPLGEEGITIPRGLDISKFWTVLEECLQRADAFNET